MDSQKEKAIRNIVSSSIQSFAIGLETRHISEANDPDGVINKKRNNCFMSVLGDEFIFYSACVRSFDSSFGKVLENLGNSIAKYSYDKTINEIEAFIMPEQEQRISNLLNNYKNHVTKPLTSHYDSFNTIIPDNVESYKHKHSCDNLFYSQKDKTYYLIELKAGADLDNKKAESEKNALLTEYFMLKNIINKDEKIIVKIATAYNKFGEGKPWHQANVETFFAKEELLIGKDYWDFVCDDSDGFDIIFDEYKNSAKYIEEVLINVKNAYNL